MSEIPLAGGPWPLSGGGAAARARLAELLRAGPGEACAPARAALLAGADAAVWPGLVAAGRLAPVYARRLRLTRRRGNETLALPGMVQTLTRLGVAPVRLGRIDAPGGWTFVLVLSPSATAVLACTGVRRVAGPPGAATRP